MCKFSYYSTDIFLLFSPNYITLRKYWKIKNCSLIQIYKEWILINAAHLPAVSPQTSRHYGWLHLCVFFLNAVIYKKSIKSSDPAPWDAAAVSESWMYCPLKLNFQWAHAEKLSSLSRQMWKQVFGAQTFAQRSSNIQVHF